MSVKVVFHSSSIDHCSKCHTFWLYNLPSLGQSSSLLMKSSCCEVETSRNRLLLVVSNHLTSRATIYSLPTTVYNKSAKRGRDFRGFKRNFFNGICCTCYYNYCMYSSCNYYHVFLLHKMQTHLHYIQILFSIFADFRYSTYITSYRFVCQSE